MHRFILLLLVLPLLIGGFTSTMSPAKGNALPLQLTPTTTPTPADTPATQSLQLVNHLGGRMDAVFVEGDYAYVNFGPELAVVDVSNPAQPVRVGYTLLPGLIKQLQVIAGYAYAITAPGCLHIVDVSNPTSPHTVGSYAAPDLCYRVAVRGNYAYIATHPLWNNDQQIGGGLRVVDISSPATPREIGFYELGQTVGDVAILAEPATNKIYAYIVAGEDTARIVDVSEPTNPQAAATKVSLPYYSKVIIRGSYAYLMGSSVLHIMDLSTPTEPVVMGIYQTTEQFENFSLGGSYAYLIARGGGWYSALQAINIANPAQPGKAGSYNLAESVQAMATSEGYLYLATRDAGLRLVNMVKPAPPVEMGFYNPPPTPIEVLSRSGDYGYSQIKIESSREGFSVLNLRNPTEPVEINRYEVPVSNQNGWTITVKGGSSANSSSIYNYIMQRDPGAEYFSHYYLQVLDTSNPVAPVKLGAYRTVGSQAEGAAIVNNPSSSNRLYVYIPTGSMGLRIVEMTDPLAPVEVGAYTTFPLLNGTLHEELKFQDYTLYIYSNEPEPTQTLVILKNDQPVYVQKEWVFNFYDPDNRDQLPPTARDIKDITGNGVPNLIVEGYTGGAHCCGSTYIFELGNTLSLIAVINTLHSAGHFEDLDSDNIPEITLIDWTFAYWPLSFASSPAPQVILRYQDGGYRPAIELMRQPAPEDLEDQAREIQTELEWWQESGPPPWLWETMLDLIYSGHADLAWPFFEQAWPAEIPGKERSLTGFLSLLSAGPYWTDVQKLNEGQWPPLLDTLPVEAELSPLPASDKVTSAMEAPVILPPFSTGQEAAGLPAEVRGPVETVFVQGNYAYAGTGSGLTVLDITLPAQPRPVGYLVLPGRVKDIYVEGATAYLAKASEWVEGKSTAGGLWTVDVSDPKAPALTVFYETVGELDDLTLLNGYLYSVEHLDFYEEGFSINGGVRVFDLSEPAAPQEIASYEMPWKPSEIDIIGTVEDYLYLSAGEGGLFILRFEP